VKWFEVQTNKQVGKTLLHSLFDV